MRFELRPHQAEAIQAFEDNGCIGLLEMATGTGKTITALEAIDRNYTKNKRQFLVIIVPFLHLIDQWVEKFTSYSITNYLRIAGNRQNWYSTLKKWVWDYKNEFRNRVVLIGSYKSMGDNEFHELISDVEDFRFLVADECHNLGSRSYQELDFSKFEFRMGLSATPRRWFDEKGTAKIFKIFDKTVYEYDLKQAIENGILSVYEYHPYLVSLNDDEVEAYEEFTKMIGMLMAKDNKTKSDIERIERYARERADIIKSAEAKLPELLRLLQQQQDKRFTLVYCAPGQIDIIVKAISSLGIRVHRFNSELNNRDRLKILYHFSKGEIEVLVAIKCLDEGVDVPATRTAYFLASSSNPREFVQRRGRVLRTSEGKEKSILIDFITLQGTLSSATLESIVKKELPRYAEFADLAINKFSSDTRSRILSLLSNHGLERYLYLKPWEIYEMMKKEEQYYDEFAS